MYTNVLSLAGVFTAPERFMPERFLESEFGTRTDIKVDLEGFRENLPFGSGRVSQVSIVS